ncbi:VWA domain-containing protein [Deltaproteobacteria bacterium OttesenSCG-928-M10]|nr:VWA domain-containing protein [Deltaproteobacteria bacterium OttesenSCG-928-M10]
MKDNLTELVFILDKSGSMSGLESDTIGGYNAMLAKQKNEPGEVVVTTVLFDDNYELLHDRIDIQAVEPITERDYEVGGTTALLDAVGRTIRKIVNAHKRTNPEYRAGKVLFVITTDGQENASREYSYDKIKGLIERQKEKYGWEFIFLGANIDAIKSAAQFGISASRAANYNADGEGTRLNYAAVSVAISNLRSSSEIRDDWKCDIDDDFQRRGGGKRRKDV